MTSLHPDYKNNLEEARVFQDIVADALYYECGVPIGVYHSMEFQCSRGESRSGFEIKLDRHFRQTNQLFIETAERASDDPNTKIKPAGIYSPDNSWIFVIGDRLLFWVFGCQTLRNIHVTGRYCTLTAKADNHTVTSEGFGLPLAHADFHAEKRIDLDV